MSRDIEKLLKELRAYRDDMVARYYPFQRISDIITRWEMDKVEVKRDFLEEAEREKKELEESYQESRRQTEERKQREWLKGYNKWKKTQDV